MVDPIIFIIIAILGGSLGVKVTSTQNPVYSGLYLVLLFFLGSAISFLLGLEFMALLFLLVYAGAIAVLVLFVVMMLDVKAIENPWSSNKKRLLYFGVLLFICILLALTYNDYLLNSIRSFTSMYLGLLVSFSFFSYSDVIKSFFFKAVDSKTIVFSNSKIPKEKEVNYFDPSTKEFRKTFKEFLDERTEMWYKLCDIEGLTEFFRLWLHKETIEGSYGTNVMWFVEFDTSCALNDPSYLLYSTHAILLIIAGVILLIAMVGAISLTLQKNCPESLYRQLGRESKNAVFVVRERLPVKPPVYPNLEVLPRL